MTNVTDSDCSICLEPLANKSVLATLYCGHVFHKECISKCTATRSTCPLCQKSIHRQNFPVIRLYLDNEATDTPNDTQQPDDKYEKLKASNLALRNKLDLLEEQYDQKDKRLEHVEKQWKADAKLMTKYKNIKEVLELDARLSADDRRNQIKLWQRLDKDDLCMVSASLYDRLSHVTAAGDVKENQLKRAYDRINSLKSRYRRLVENEAPQKRPASPISDRMALSKKRTRALRGDEILSAKKQDKRPAIQVDSGDDTEDPDDKFWIPPVNTHMKKATQMSHTDQNAQPSSSNNSSTDRQQSRHRMSENERRQTRKNKLHRMGIWRNGVLPPVMMNVAAHGSDSNSNSNSNSNNDSENNDEDHAFSDNILSDNDDGYDSPSSPLPPIRIVSPVRKINLSKMALLNRVIELSSDEENENYA